MKNFMEFHEIPWKSMELHEIFHETEVDEISWNSIENSVEFH
jgi:hypothetical protein